MGVVCCKLIRLWNPRTLGTVKWLVNGCLFPQSNGNLKGFWPFPYTVWTRQCEVSAHGPVCWPTTRLRPTCDGQNIKGKICPETIVFSPLNIFSWFSHFWILLDSWKPILNGVRTRETVHDVLSGPCQSGCWC